MKEMYCITCPTGCLLKVYEYSANEHVDVEGNLCEKGVDFAMAEITNPTRSLTTTVRTTFFGIPVLPVRTDGEIPKDKIMQAMKELSGIVVSTELGCGDVIVEDIASTGVNVIASSDMLTAHRRSADISRSSSSDFYDVKQTGTYEHSGPSNDYNDYPEEELFEEEEEPQAAEQTKGRARIEPK